VVAEILLEGRVERDVALVVGEQIELQLIRAGPRLPGKTFSRGLRKLDWYPMTYWTLSERALSPVNLMASRRKRAR